jgi:hypothetical protein
MPKRETGKNRLTIMVSSTFYRIEELIDQVYTVPSRKQFTNGPRSNLEPDIRTFPDRSGHW